MFFGGHKVAKIFYIGLPLVTMVNTRYSYHGEYTLHPRFFRGAAASLTPPSGGRAGARGPRRLCWVSTNPGRYLLVLIIKFHIECSKNHVCRPLGVRDMTTFVKHVFVAEIARGYNHSRKQL